MGRVKAIKHPCRPPIATPRARGLRMYNMINTHYLVHSLSGRWYVDLSMYEGVSES